jgi:hypothetical protein
VQYLKLKLTGDAAPPWWELKLFYLYDATDYAINLYNTSTIAYNGEIDPQKQATDMMEQAMAEEGLRLIRVIGPQTAHKYPPDSKAQIADMLDAIAERGRDPYPRTVKFTTWTLAYNRMKWVSIDALGQLCGGRSNCAARWALPGEDCVGGILQRGVATRASRPVGKFVTRVLVLAAFPLLVTLVFRAQKTRSHESVNAARKVRAPRPNPYCSRNTCIGSNRAARIAGNSDARTDTASTMPTTPLSVAASQADTP